MRQDLEVIKSVVFLIEHRVKELLDAKREELQKHLEFISNNDLYNNETRKEGELPFFEDHREQQIELTNTAIKKLNLIYIYISRINPLSDIFEACTETKEKYLVSQSVYIAENVLELICNFHEILLEDVYIINLWQILISEVKNLALDSSEDLQKAVKDLDVTFKQGQKYNPMIKKLLNTWILNLIKMGVQNPDGTITLDWYSSLHAVAIANNRFDAITDGSYNIISAIKSIQDFISTPYEVNTIIVNLTT